MSSKLKAIVLWLLVASHQHRLSDAGGLNADDESILIVETNKISRLWPSTMEVEVLPLSNPSNLFAVDFDAHNNCLFWHNYADSQLQRQCFGKGSKGVEVLIKLANRPGRISYDWVNDAIYLTNTAAARIEVVHLSKQPREVETVVQLSENQRPWGIAVDPNRNYVFFASKESDTRTSPMIGRCDLAGDDLTYIAQEPLTKYPDLIAIDYLADRVYWTDADYSQVASCDFDGNDYRTVVKKDDFVNRPYSVAVLNEHVYWGDYNLKTFSHLKVNSWNYLLSEMRILPKKPRPNVFWTWFDKREVVELKIVSKAIQTKSAEVDPRIKP